MAFICSNKDCRATLAPPAESKMTVNTGTRRVAITCPKCGTSTTFNLPPKK